jgi:hypothetical protein
VLSAVGFQAFMGMLALVGTTIGAGWLLDESGSQNRKSHDVYHFRSQRRGSPGDRNIRLSQVCPL